MSKIKNKRKGKDQMFLDNASTTPLSKGVKDYLISILDIYGNPSSSHSVGREAKYIIDNARKNVAQFIGTTPDNIIFTSGGSASNCLAIMGMYKKHNCTILYSPIAHKSILKCVEKCKHSYPLKVDNKGFIDMLDLREWLDSRQINPFVIIDYANAEIGTVQHVKEIIDLVHFYNGKVMLDCTQSITQIPIDIKSLDADLVSFSGHKLGALKGIGCLYKKPNIELEPLIYGLQEQGLFAGTEGFLNIASLGKAIEEFDYSSINSLGRDYILNYVMSNIPKVRLVGASIENRLPHNLNLLIKDVEGESLMMALDMSGYQISVGSACSSGDLSPSTTLTAIGLSNIDANSCVRITLSGSETLQELDEFCAKFKEYIERLRTWTN